ncbi:hypothetical protein Tco_1043304 [Tanacetum coccineum]|uniref:Uncharacterized protein n=1 Tax=Tanacetum coccineum TaxID=301880 RepID=A0ABQ5GMZ1_9ASTR
MGPKGDDPKGQSRLVATHTRRGKHLVEWKGKQDLGEVNRERVDEWNEQGNDQGLELMGLEEAMGCREEPVNNQPRQAGTQSVHIRDNHHYTMVSTRENHNMYKLM